MKLEAQFDRISIQTMPCRSASGLYLQIVRSANQVFAITSGYVGECGSNWLISYYHRARRLDLISQGRSRARTHALFHSLPDQRGKPRIRILKEKELFSFPPFRSLT